MITLPHVASRVFGEPLAIERQKLDVIITAIGPRLRGMPFDDDEEDDDEDALVLPDRGITPDGIAVIDICGTLVAKTSGMDALSGLTSYADIAEEYASAMRNAAVRGIMLSIDSPGGEVKGMFDLAATMYSLRGTKPVCAFVDCAASAAYLLASTADQIVVSSVGITGSVGVIALHLDESKADEQAGLKYTAIFAGDRKNDGNPHEPLTPEARDSLQSRIDTIYGMFTSAVARNRGMSDEAVRKTQAGIYMGQDGVNVGFADYMGTEDDAMSALSMAASNGMKTLSAMAGTITPIAITAGTISVTNSVASATGKGETAIMAEQTKPVPAEAKTPTPAEIEAMITAAALSGRGEAALIANMCAIAGRPEMVGEFLASGKTATQVGTELVNAKAVADKQIAIDPGIMPGADAKRDSASSESLGKAKPWSEIIARLNGKGVK